MIDNNISKVAQLLFLMYDHNRETSLMNFFLRDSFENKLLKSSFSTTI
jgi:hypothetical protein